MATTLQPPDTSSAAPAAAPEARRGFFTHLAALVIGLVLYVPAAAAGLWALVNPLREKRSAGRFVRLTTLDALPKDGTPQRFPIIAERTDAWTHYPQEAIGAVYLRLGGPNQVEALQAVCPHAGCHVTFQSPEKIYFCPCHAASFEISGKRKDAQSQSPRDLDTLSVEIRNKSEVWVRFERFRTGTPQKIAEA